MKLCTMNSRRCVLCACLLLLPLGVNGDFVYFNFNDTSGMELVGNAATSNCDIFSENRYVNTAAANDEDSAITLHKIRHERSMNVEKETIETDQPFQGATFQSTTATINRTLSSFGHRDQYAQSPTMRCPVRIRLTPSQPFKTGAVWHKTPAHIYNGFEVNFMFQITDQSRACVEVMDPDFGTKHHKSCSVHGGDGFAFVIQGNSNKTASLGLPGAGMGYAEISNSIAIEFDTHYNPESGDLLMNHISIQSEGLRPNSAGHSGTLGRVVPYSLADGRIHWVKIRYYDEIKPELVPYFSATEKLSQFIMDHSEQRRVGTLAVFIDDNAAAGTNINPVLAMPINLAIALRLEQDMAYMGFTSSTGFRWEKHDILSWWFCEEPPCLTNDGVPVESQIDYGQSNELNSNSNFMSTFSSVGMYIFPDMAAWSPPKSYFANGLVDGLGPLYQAEPWTFSTSDQDDTYIQRAQEMEELEY